MPEDTARRYYDALLRRDPDYEGVFYVGVRTTGVFCRPTCPARKPRFENCRFFDTPKAALHAGFRPCMRCRPLSHPNEMPEVVRRLVEAVEREPERRWRDADFRALGVDVSTARRAFKRRFGMTFVEYARARRMGLALKALREGGTVIEAQLEAGYESGSGFRDAFNRIIGSSPSAAQGPALTAAWLDTPLGPMLAVADDEGLVLLEFVERRGLETELRRLRARAAIVPGSNPVLASIERELAEYFAGQRHAFTVPLRPVGSEFQRAVWDELLRIPPGETRSYGEIAAALGRPTASRAVARANGSNQLAIVIPCHRVVNADGTLGGYGGGVPRKEWLLAHERRWFAPERPLFAREASAAD
ncbi:MAG TPA: trifunctional transcriptional activator/DNA repair protein Ada/methylated-DNA--[protein]-cysteine S-methyltransferase [Trueperaceae bacterium]|jgi:AraC family transcriptional regulator of adaptative response/methylated-DNA-[protein]-cysteine methyltransferase|nr:trifunctional transcriptional activator/DNA repair protein Ada/methylated-DNA--[protein]-cysteine S-methyltransferase [Trueperaceae bacterium]